MKWLLIILLPFLVVYMAFAFCKLGYSVGSARWCDCEMAFYLAFCVILSYVFSSLFGG